MKSGLSPRVRLSTRVALIALLLGVMSCRTANESAQLSSPMDPHFKKTGPWFEGWYTRLIDDKNRVDLAIIVGSLVRDKEAFSESPLNGYVAIVYHEMDTGQTKIYEQFLPSTTLFAKDGPVHENPDVMMSPDFEWLAEGVGSFSHDTIKLHIAGGPSIEANISDPLPIHEKKPWLGPEGMMANMPFLWSHWFVYSMGSKADYRLTLGNDINLAGTAVAHQEKNYGSTFPTGWIWVNGLSKNEDIHVILAGGPAPLAYVHPEVWSAIIKTAKIDWAMLPGVNQLNVTRTIESCTGKFTISLWNPLKRIEVHADSSYEDFIGVATPSISGWQKDGAKESYKATLTLKAFSSTTFGREELVEQFTLGDAVLEFGGKYRCMDQP